MPLTKAQCPNCGGVLDVDSLKEVAVCPFCNTPYIVEKAINTYNTNITNHIKTGTVIIQGKGNTDFIIKNVDLIEYLGHDKDVIIPDYVENISHAFVNLQFIKSVVLPNSLKEIGWQAFFYCTGISNIKIPKNVTAIRESAFAHCSGLLSIDIPDNVKCLGDSCFSGCSELKDIHIGKGITEISYGAFCCCTSLSEVLIPKNIIKLGTGDAENNGGGVFECCKNLVSVKIENGVRIIGDSCFAYCENLMHINIPDSVIEIGGGAFANCKKLTSITIPDSVKRIGGGAFQNCSCLTNVITNNKSLLIGKLYGTPLESQYRDKAYEKFWKQHSYNNSGCYIATCVYGSYDCPQVWTLRRYRDNTLAQTWYGRAFIKTYYAISPTLVKWFGNISWVKRLWQGKLDRMVAKLQAKGIESTPYKDKKR